MPDINILDLLFSLIITIAIYSLPIIVFRYLILEHSVDKKTAKIITAVYAIIGFIIMAVVVYLIDGEAATGGGLILWSYVNYKMLIGGNNKKAKAETPIKPISDKPLLATKTVEKVKYCKHCGNPIDSKTKKCSGCEKQYFHMSKRLAVISVLLAVIVCLMCLNVFQYIYNNQKIHEISSELALESEDLIVMTNHRNELMNKLSDKQIELDFWNNHAVIVTETGIKYHHYNCQHVRTCTSFRIYNSEAAKSLGYTPCLDCFGG